MSRLSLTNADLWALVRQVSERALTRGALLPITTAREIIAEDGIDWLIHVVERIDQKDRLTRAQQATGTNPFLPYDTELFITEVEPAHVALLNRFNVIDRHLLIITRHFEAQEELLGPDDFQALWRCMAAGDGLAFYNGGLEAGASQSHKHLQLVPVPLGLPPRQVPIEAVFHTRQGDGTLAALPFAHTLRWIDPDMKQPAADVATRLHHAYLEMLACFGITDHSRPYNLLLTRRWMLVVPRSKEKYRGVSVNGLGFAGSLLVRSRDELEMVRQIGPMQVLSAVAEG